MKSQRLATHAPMKFGENLASRIPKFRKNPAGSCRAQPPLSSFDPCQIPAPPLARSSSSQIRNPLTNSHLQIDSISSPLLSMAVLGSRACGGDDKENVPPMPAVAAAVAASSWHGIAVVKNQRMKRPGGGGGKLRRRVPLRDITNLMYVAARPPAPPAASSVTAAARSREEPVAAAAALPARRSLRKEFR
ncbi:hypothetical protein DAI22_02g108100 [Oryza sativa Japonica Group]|nr:hypothetical protein DAI22_02g108100 [Oryza sativa Japonica Group]